MVVHDRGERYKTSFHTVKLTGLGKRRGRDGTNDNLKYREVPFPESSGCRTGNSRGTGYT